MLYTRKGDDGSTKLFDSEKGVRVSKTSPIFEALGSVDELNSAIGYAKTLAQEKYPDIALNLEKIQGNLFNIQGELAGADTHILIENISFLEKIISDIEEKLTPINSFIIPGGTPLGAYLDLCRTIARRTERVNLKLKESGEEKTKNETLIFLNRLSSVLYALARRVNQDAQITEKTPDYKN